MGGPQGNFYGKEKEEDNPIDGNISRGFLISYYEDPMRLVLWINDVVLCRAAQGNMMQDPCFGIGRRTVRILEVAGDGGYEAVRAGS